MFLLLDANHAILLVICLIAACAFEFINGFHDAANAVATVIYTNSLKPRVAVILSGIFNFIGTMTGGIAVAMAIVNLLPVEALVDQNINHGIAMVLGILLSAIFWNFLTWYLGIPCSSSHTLIGSILGVGIAYYLLPDSQGMAVNWGKVGDIGLSLLISPIFGFSATIFLMYLLKRLTKKDKLFKEPPKNTPPSLGIRSLLILSCTSVSFFHGSNDGQKGVGLVMLILIGIVPAYFALNPDVELKQFNKPINELSLIIENANLEEFGLEDKKTLQETLKVTYKLDSITHTASLASAIPEENRFLVRSELINVNQNLKDITSRYPEQFSNKELATIKSSLSELKPFTEYSPIWVLVMISTSIGLGTMIGWKRIVVTIGEKIGKQHLTYAQGASAEMVAATTIGLSSAFGLPVSTTHVLSSGIAGSMVASKGLKNLNNNTIKNIALAWVLTLPVVIFLSASLFLLFRWISDLL
ncbi:inorganic phosphate transporter [Marivirga sp.]|uniref:inorganic phosphate transporter n=1 Tax=Marivirga sp. TaxID=2018662 RepID=UPI002D7E3171|nr:inorganic phosphate transporter [Marivirga sp.]HET8860881.1 anion permease [Marivirga sp.]